MKFSMSDDEIRVSYNTAKDQKAQVKVLAELNVTTPAAMAAKLRELGCNVPDFPSVDQRPLRAHDILFDETRARELFAEGKTDLDIAEMLGIGVYAFAAWRCKNGMKRPRGGDMQKMEQKAKPKRCKAQPPMPPEIETPEPEPASILSVISFAILSSHPGKNAAVSAPTIQPVPVIPDSAALPFCTRTTRSPSVTKSCFPVASTIA